MADLLPSSPDVDPPEEPRVVGVDSDDAEDLLAALSSETARGILATLHEEPSPPSRVAERVDTSLQNAQYHLGRLEDAGVVEVADTVYSEKGREMKVYAPADRALVVVAGPQEESDGLRSALSRLLGGVGALAIGSVVVDRLARRFGLGPAAPTADRGAGGAAEVETSGEATVAEDAGDAGGAGGASGGDGGADGAGGTPSPSGGDDAGVMAVGNESGTATATPSPTESDLGTLSEPSATATETTRETATSTPMATGTPTSTPTPMATETATPTPAPTPTPTPTPTSTPTATPTPTVTAEPATTVAETTTAVATTEPTTPVAALASSPGALFFLGGLTVLLAWFALVAYRTRP